MAAELRRIWGGILIPAQLHRDVGSVAGPRGLNRAAETGLRRLLSGECACTGPRPARDGGSVTITVRVPVQLSDTADRWRADRGLSRQALVEYALLAALATRTRSGRVGSTEVVESVGGDRRR